jgi:lycopene beta-cyclase
MKQYDYIFTGAGCAGLSLLTRMIDAGLTAGKKILLIDKSPKLQNDRTWCFWENQPGFFEQVVCKQWDRLWFHAPGFSHQLDIAPYRYKMIRGKDFYNHCLHLIAAHQNIEWLYGTVSEARMQGNTLSFLLDNKPMQLGAGRVFNSIWQTEKIKAQKAIHLLQHFKGWMVETPAPFFNPGEATLMDFRVSQAAGATFVYVLPLSATRALVEYTLFSEKVMPIKQYDDGLASYLAQWLHLKEYTVTEEEFGVIPMTNAAFPWFENGVYHIGTAGGQTKASSGYTFQFIQKQGAAIVEQVRQQSLNAVLRPAQAAGKYHFYDSVLLGVLANKLAEGSSVFTAMFKHNPAQQIFAFLDNETSLAQDLRIMSSLPTTPFLKSALRYLFY